MINVNWSKIKKYEKKGFAISAAAAELALAAALTVIGISIGAGALCYPAAVLFMLTAALYIHIESRMLQIYMLLGVLDVLCCVFTVLRLSGGAASAVFAVSAVLFAAGAALSFLIRGYLTKDTAYKPAVSGNAGFFSDRSVMFFSPHEDDEINVYAGIIEQYVKNGSEVRLVFYTNGDFYGIGQTRIREELDVADSYGIPRENVIFLGYSDALVNNSLHIYNAEGSTEYTSVKGYTETYGSKEHPAFANGRKFTRDNILEDFVAVIRKYMPDTLYCCDYDGHSDHRAIGLFFERALDEILRSDGDYRPSVYKGFGYSTAWNGKQDYYSLNMISTRKTDDSPLMAENNIYEWENRVRMPVADEMLSRVIQNSSSYAAMMQHSSQTSTDHAFGVLNGDKVFWERRTDSVLLGAEVISTSGDASRLTDFCLADSDDITNTDALPCSNAWVADENDSERSVLIRLPAARSIRLIRIYANPNTDCRIINAKVKLGDTVFDTGEIDNYRDFSLSGIAADRIGIHIEEFEGVCSILKVEAFETPNDSAPRLIKLMNGDGDFCYDYCLGSQTENFTVYTYPKQENAQLEISVSGDITAYENGGIITVSCEENKRGTLRIALRQHPEIFDEVHISNPDEKQREGIKTKQRLEQIIWSFPMLRDYYVGLVRRLGVYKR